MKILRFTVKTVTNDWVLKHRVTELPSITRDNRGPRKPEVNYPSVKNTGDVFFAREDRQHGKGRRNPLDSHSLIF